MTSPSILVVEDDPPLRTLLARNLRQFGYAVRTAVSGAEMWVALKAGPVDLIVLDIMLPGTNGIDLLRTLRQQSEVPVIFISARGSETDRIIGLELGADDYLVKPFSTRELVARIGAVLRRHAKDGSSGEPRNAGAVTFDGWTLSQQSRELRSPDGALVDLTTAEFDLLTVFVQNSRRAIGRERLIEMSRDRIGDSSDRSIDVMVSRLRRKLSREGADAPIATIRGVGYMLSSEVMPA
ncbi:response regulator [Croceicoccus bisphenolivorans]|uniref:response regulator n=1 Tax=Croceicoccus bisphenolivorans TaxID=1783232 RepID=UPI000830B7D6|nr:response regulator transcription factor [Croceicoccus bisphenolivorans]